jgi:LacI family transcriptional regulator
MRQPRIAVKGPLVRTIYMTFKMMGDFHRQVTRGIIDFSHQFADVNFAVGFEPSPEELAALGDVGLICFAGNHALIATARQLGRPCVALGSSHREPDAPQVLTDEPLLGRMAAQHFAELGLRHFAFTGHSDWPFTQPRLRAFTRALRTMGLKAPSRFVRLYYTQGRRVPIDTELQLWLSELPKPCGVLAATDYIAQEVIVASRRAGLRVPDDLAVLGVDNDDIASALSPVAISSIAIPAYAYGYEAARLLHEQWNTPRTRSRVVRISPVRTVQRASTDLLAIDDPDVAQAIRLIRDHAHESIDVAWVAARLPVSRRSLERKFKHVTGQTLLDRIHQVRFDHIKRLLAETDLPLKIIARRTGMVNAKWLSDSFRKYAGVTPTAYRQQFRPPHDDLPASP